MISSYRTREEGRLCTLSSHEFLLDVYWGNNPEEAKTGKRRRGKRSKSLKSGRDRKCWMDGWDDTLFSIVVDRPLDLIFTAVAKTTPPTPTTTTHNIRS